MNYNLEIAGILEEAIDDTHGDRLNQLAQQDLVRVFAAGPSGIVKEYDGLHITGATLELILQLIREENKRDVRNHLLSYLEGDTP